ncbi:hypothetical protein EJ08DRAFT_709288 [Tothia fuscella]|uniref:Uncharacterized protein n=1 Tax=Tothia fuscella TaxID=1048955 RepID=A0A9P4TRD7_9PEZI|nr:hypothetical protein EJ08DRAFT_709288 [Tothia fuscella]
MCQYEQLNFRCAYSCRRLHKHCHFARNDPDHFCFGPYSINSTFDVPEADCPWCDHVTRNFPTKVYIGTGGQKNIEKDLGGGVAKNIEQEGGKDMEKEGEKEVEKKVEKEVGMNADMDVDMDT